MAVVEAELERFGLLMQHDAALPSVTSIVAGEPVRGSWWGHPKGREVFRVLTELEENVAFAKLVARKVTLVHRRLWGALAAVGSSREAWQTTGLARDAATILAHVEEQGRVSVPDLEPSGKRTLAAVVTELEHRLLVYSAQEHSPSGKHIRVLTSWRPWSESVGVASELPPIAEARAAFETAVQTWPRGAALLPWTRRA